MQTIDSDTCKFLAHEIRSLAAKDNREQLFLNHMERLCKAAGFADQNAALSDKQFKWLEDILIRESQEW